jgi:prefoldin subunit 5
MLGVKLMSENKEQVQQELNAFKAQAYDILAQLEYLHNQYQKQVADLQKQLESVNQQIAAKSQVLKSLEQEERKDATY